jgi:electron transfer flavoprotein alpha/beta subunit
MLKIVVCVKAVPDPKDEHKIYIDPKTKNLVRGDISLVLNSLDKHAIEAALQLKAQQGAHITVLSMGPPAAGNIIKECLALGADRGVLLSDREFAGADAYATAYTLARGIEKLGTYDIVLCGTASSDSGTEWVGPEVAVLLGIPVVTMVQEIVKIDTQQFTVKSDWENGYRLVRTQLPAVLTITRDLNTPRTLSFSGIIKARKKEIEQWALADMQIDAHTIGIKGSPTIVSDMEVLESRREVEIIEGEREEKAERLIQKLAESGVV